MLAVSPVFCKTLARRTWCCAMHMLPSCGLSAQAKKQSVLGLAIFPECRLGQSGSRGEGGASLGASWAARGLPGSGCWASAWRMGMATSWTCP